MNTREVNAVGLPQYNLKQWHFVLGMLSFFSIKSGEEKEQRGWELGDFYDQSHLTTRQPGKHFLAADPWREYGSEDWLAVSAPGQDGTLFSSAMKWATSPTSKWWQQKVV